MRRQRPLNAAAPRRKGDAVGRAKAGRARKEPQAAPPLARRRSVLLGLRARDLGRDRRRRPLRLLRLATAADRSTRRAQAPAQYRHSRRGREPARQSRRHRRRGGAPAGLPPYLPKAFIAIEDRRFYSHWGIDPGRHFSRAVAQRDRARRRAGRLDPDPATGQKPVPDPGAHGFAQDPGGDPGAVAGA